MGMCASSGVLVVVIHAVVDASLSSCSLRVFYINKCLSNPCQNGGTCSDIHGGFQCFCPEGFKGDYCQTGMSPPSQLRSPDFPLDASDSVHEIWRVMAPRDHSVRARFDFFNLTDGSSLTVGYGSSPLMTTILVELTGSELPEDITSPTRELWFRFVSDTGDSSRRKRRAVGSLMESGFLVNLTAERTEDINECLSNPCQNGGTCSDIHGGFQCFCPEGFKGDYCQTG
eukprot:XP_011674230.1 PREDICTED: fibropellin-1-like [Strongylocentrotus purpuratus]